MDFGVAERVDRHGHHPMRREGGQDETVRATIAMNTRPPHAASASSRGGLPRCSRRRAAAGRRRSARSRASQQREQHEGRAARLQRGSCGPWSSSQRSARPMTCSRAGGKAREGWNAGNWGSKARGTASGWIASRPAAAAPGPPQRPRAAAELRARARNTHRITAAARRAAAARHHHDAAEVPTSSSSGGRGQASFSS